jgi:hypothetical protein
MEVLRLPEPMTISVLGAAACCEAFRDARLSIMELLGRKQS